MILRQKWHRLLVVVAYLLMFIALGVTTACEKTQVTETPQTAPAFVTPTVSLPKISINASELAVVINDNDVNSVAIGEYYRVKRNIPVENIIHVSFDGTTVNMDLATFNAMRAAVVAATPANVQAYALAWMKPYRVNQWVSMTSAMTFGYRAGDGGGVCNTTLSSSYYGSKTAEPFTDLGLRPSMMLAGTSSQNVFDLIDRGLAAEGTEPTGTAYFMRTTDAARSVRYADFIGTRDYWNIGTDIHAEYNDNSSGAYGADYIENKTDVLFYLTSLYSVPNILTNQFLPGAVADNLTSCAGMLEQEGCGQMSALKWLEAGATGSFGTVIEPCNFTTKFPSSGELLRQYFSGNTLVEAYWKSVLMPGQGLFIGDPLARPWGKVTIDTSNQALKITTGQLHPSEYYMLLDGATADGPFNLASPLFQVPRYQKHIVELAATKSGHHYKLTAYNRTNLPAQTAPAGSENSNYFLYTYLTNSKTAALRINIGDGSLTSLDGGPLNTGDAINLGFVLDPLKRFFVFVDTMLDKISFYGINAQNGFLTEASGSPNNITVGSGADSSVFTPNGNFFYSIASYTDEILAYMVAANGSLTPVAGSPFFTPSGSPYVVTVSTDGKYLYVATMNGKIDGFQINQATGALTAFNATWNPYFGTNGGFVSDMEVDLAGKFLYLLTLNDNYIRTYSINSTTGRLTLVGSPSSAGAPHSLSFHPSGNFLYISSYTANIVAFRVDPATGVISYLSGSHSYNYTSPLVPRGSQVDPTGRFLYVAAGGQASGENKILIYTIEPTLGFISKYKEYILPEGDPSHIRIAQFPK